MSEILEKIYNYYCELYPNVEREKVVATMDSTSVNIAIEIAEYAHRNQKQLNGKPYILHPYDCMQNYKTFLNIQENDYFCMDADLLEELEIPFNGVQEVCMLHDVLEDTNITMEEIEKIYCELGLNKYFILYIKDALLLVTHDKKESYETYMKEVLKSPISAMVKLMDLTSNMNLLRLNEWNKENESRFLKYFKCFKQIEEEFHFIEKVNTYNKKMESKK